MADDIISSAISRFLKIGGMVSQLGLKVALEKSIGVFLGEEKRENRQKESWGKIAEKIVTTLSQLKGGAMKVGQMISLQEGLLPPEFISVMRLLQKEADPLPFQKMRPVLDETLPDWRTIFAGIEEKPFAAASIGQVHRGHLLDGREVAVKIQYPGMEKVIHSDLQNLKTLFKLLASLVLNVDMEPIWEEVKKQMLLEVDYDLEAANQLEFIRLFEGDSTVVIPRPVKEASSRTVLTTEMVTGEDINAAMRNRMPVVNEWAVAMLNVFFRQFFEFKLVHADPNLANYGFLPDGRIILYDFGQVKEVMPVLSDNYRHIVKALFAGEVDPIPPLLAEIGIRQKEGDPISADLVKQYTDVFAKVFTEGEYLFHPEDHLVKKFMDITRQTWAESKDIIFPPQIIFVNRAFGGLLSNLSTLRGRADWGSHLRHYSA